MEEGKSAAEGKALLKTIEQTSYKFLLSKIFPCSQCFPFNTWINNLFIQ